MRLASIVGAAWMALAPAHAAVMVLDTPSYTVNIDVRCEEGQVSCDKVHYKGTHRKNGQSIALKGKTLHTLCADGVTPCRFLGYVFANGKTRYTVLEEGELTVQRGDKTLIREKGTWR